MLLKKIIPVVIICLIAITSFGQNPKVVEYIQSFRELAIKEMQRTGVPAAITLAQGILESQSGESELAKRSNNHFGIKCKTEWTGEKVYHDDDARGECFRKYNDAEQSYIDHSDFLKTRTHYAFLFSLDPTDFEGWAKGLKKAGYATSPTYAQRIIDVIQRYNLQEYTLIALERSKTEQKEMFAFANVEKKESVAAAVATDTVVNDTLQDVAVNTVTKEDGSLTGTENKPAFTATMALYKASDYPQSPFTINGARVVFVNEGTSLLALANQFKISYKKLLEFNDMDEAKATDILGYDQLIFLSKKAKKGNKDVHVMLPNESLEVIAQKEGIQLESLLAYNRIPKGRQPLVGEKIYLKTNSPVTPKLAEASAKN
jgi:LysM repeat protein